MALANPNRPADDIKFTRQQVALLERVFPELFVSPDTTEAALRHVGGQRSVIAFIKARQDK